MALPHTSRRGALVSAVTAASAAAVLGVGAAAPAASAATPAPSAPAPSAPASSGPVSATADASLAAASSPYSDTPLRSWRTNGSGYAALVVGGTVYIGGTFGRVTSPSGTTVNRSNLAAFNLSTGALITSFTANVNGAVRALATDGSKLYIGGSFSRVNGAARERLAAVSLGSGSVSSWSARASNTVYALAVKNGTLYAGGAFGTLNGSSRSRLGAVSTSSGSLGSWNPSANGTVRGIAVSGGGTVYVGGAFRAINGSGRYGDRLAAISASGSLQRTDFGGVDGAVLSVDLTDDGSRVAAAMTTNRSGLWSLSGTRLWTQRCDGDAQAVLARGSYLYSGFHDGCGGVSGDKLTVNALSGGARDTSFHPGLSPFYGVWDLDANSSRLVAAGAITSSGGVRLGGFAIYPAR